MTDIEVIEIMLDGAIEHLGATIGAAFAALTAAGLVVRPKEPTEEMLDRGADKFKTAPREYDDDNRALMGLVYKAMVDEAEK